MGERGRGLTENARHADSLRRLTARVALGVRPRARSWCAPYPPARGLGARERRARGDGRDERNDAKPPTKSGARTRPVTVTYHYPKQLRRSVKRMTCMSMQQNSYRPDRRELFASNPSR